MMSDFQQKLPQAGVNPAIGSYRVKAPVTDAGPVDSGEGQSHSGRVKPFEQEEKREMLEVTGGFARSEKLKRTPTKKGRQVSRGAMGAELSGASSEEGPPLASIPLGEKRRRVKENCSLMDEGKHLVEVVVEKVEDLDRVVKAARRPNQELLHAVMEVRSALRAVARRERAEKEKENEREMLRDEVKSLRKQLEEAEKRCRGEVETTVCATQTDTPEERRVAEQRERIRDLVASGELLEALRERWEAGLFLQTKVAHGDPMSEGYRSDLAVIVGEGDSPLKERVLAWLPELAEMGDEHEAGTTPFLVQSCRMRKGGGTETKLGELAAEGSNVKLRFYLQEANETNRGKGTKEEEGVIIVAREEGTSYLDVLRRVRQVVAKRGQDVKVGTVRETKKGEVLLTVPKGEKGGQLRELLSKELGGSRVRGGTGRSVAFLVHGVDGIATGEEVVGAVATAAGVERGWLRLLSLRPSFLVEGEAVRRLRRITDLQVGISRCRLRERRETGRCFRCWEVGHRAGECKGEDRSRLCARCAQGGHKAATCRTERYCPICMERGHSAGGPGCGGPKAGGAPKPGSKPETEGEPKAKGKSKAVGESKAEGELETGGESGTEEEPEAGGEPVETTEPDRAGGAKASRTTTFPKPLVNDGKRNGDRRRKDGPRKD
ncbi:uncharacterized protein [Euwallacea fornicatus]|uniref:uncharacterized protein n=1 Tax=Euwallacea fornicatus TaxID=995702 RepID=UPI00338D819B